jgi:hypothetical protein
MFRDELIARRRPEDEVDREEHEEDGDSFLPIN